MNKSILNKKFVYFHIDELNRDSITAGALKKELKNSNTKLNYGGRKYFMVVKYFAFLFDAIILPKPHFLRYAKKSFFKNANVIMLYTENIGIIADSENKKMVLKGALDAEFMSGDSDYVDNVSAFCFWGSGVRDTIVKYYPYLKEKCFVIGHPRHDKHALPKKKKCDATGSNKKKIGIITRHTYFNNYNEQSPLEKLALYADDNTLYEYYNTETNDYLVNERRGSKPENNAFCEAVDAKYIYIIIKEAIKKGFEVEVKTHPREKEGTWAKIFEKKGLPVKFIDSSIPITHWLNEIDYLIGPPSSSFFDSVMLGLFPISNENLDERRAQFVMDISDENNKLMEHVAAPSSVEELFDIIENKPVVQYTDALNAVLLEEADYPHCSDSMEKLAAIIVKVSRNNIKKSGLVKWCGISLYLISANMINTLFWFKHWGNKNISSSFIVTPGVSKFIDNLPE